MPTDVQSIRRSFDGLRTQSGLVASQDSARSSTWALCSTASKCADVPNFALPFPPLPEQRAIAHILGTLDDKIELNRRMNATLEAMARALFKSWFVDFDPVRAKAEGRDTGLPREIADLFPDGFEESEVGEVPKGWRVEMLGELLDLAYATGAATEDDRATWGIARLWFERASSLAHEKT